MAKYRWLKWGPKSMFEQAYRRYGEPQWTIGSLASQRLRLVIRLIALEERLRERGAGALPPRVMISLKLISDYQSTEKGRYYIPAGRKARLYTDIPLDRLACECGHTVEPGAAPAIARLIEGDRLLDLGQVNEGVFCSIACARPRRVRYLIEQAPGPLYYEEPQVVKFTMPEVAEGAADGD